MAEIDYSDKRGPISVTTRDGRVYTADQVIITVPLGILKAKDIIFKPNLPQSKQDAIGRIGIALLDKLYLEFDKCFWDPNVDLINHVSEDWVITLNILKHHTGKPILCMFLSGKGCLKHADMGDDEVIASAMRAL